MIGFYIVFVYWIICYVYIAIKQRNVDVSDGWKTNGLSVMMCIVLENIIYLGTIYLLANNKIQ